MNADGTNQVNLTNSARDERDPAWSPDGTKIAFSRQPSAISPNWDDMDLFVMNADGSDQTLVASTDADDVEATWSPDGAKIAFVSHRAFGGSIEVVTLATGQRTTLTSDHLDGAPDWSPDGTTIAFDRVRVWGAVTDGPSAVSRTSTPWTPTGPTPTP
ncbi:MAG: TolB family protein [Acidimicrobiales bacterium]